MTRTCTLLSVLVALLLVMSASFVVAQQGGAGSPAPVAQQHDPNALEAERDRLQAELDVARDERDNLVADLGTAQDTIEHLGERIRLLEGEISSLQGELQGTRTALAERNDELSRQLVTAESDVARAAEENRRLRQELATLRRELQAATAPVVCDYNQSLAVLWQHRDFDQDHLADVEAVLEAADGPPFATIAYDDDSFWGAYVGRDAANLRAYIRDMRLDGVAKDAALVEVDGTMYVVFVCDCGVKAVYRLEKPAPAVTPALTAPQVRSCPSQVTVRVTGNNPNCTGACVAARAAAAAARACQ